LRVPGLVRNRSLRSQAGHSISVFGTFTFTSISHLQALHLMLQGLLPSPTTTILLHSGQLNFSSSQSLRVGSWSIFILAPQSKQDISPNTLGSKPSQRGQVSGGGDIFDSTEWSSDAEFSERSSDTEFSLDIKPSLYQREREITATAAGMKVNGKFKSRPLSCANCSIDFLIEIESDAFPDRFTILIVAPFSNISRKEGSILETQAGVAPELVTGAELPGDFSRLTC